MSHNESKDKSRSFPKLLKRWIDQARQKLKRRRGERGESVLDVSEEDAREATRDFEIQPVEFTNSDATPNTPPTGDKRKWAAMFGGGKFLEKLKNLEFDFKRMDLKNVSEYAPWITKGLVVLGVFLAAELTTRMIGLWIRPSYLPLPRKMVSVDSYNLPPEDYESILKRNIFNVEGKIPEAFDQGKLDCFAQAKPSTSKISLLGTIVMTDEKHSVALIQDESGGNRIGVKKDDTFFSDGRYQALKVDRKRFCFQVRSSQDLEYIEIPEENASPTSGSALTSFGSPQEGITALSETDYTVKKGVVENALKSMDSILQTARAVPYVEPGTGKFKGFLVQSIESNSPFAALGIKTGDVISSVNGIAMDNPGKGLEAFQQLKSSTQIALKVLRGGQETTINYSMK